jgi:hypothetical protein
MLELEAMRLIVGDLDRLVAETTVGTVPREDVASVFVRHSAKLPADSALLDQLDRLAKMIRQGPTRTRAEGLRQISRKMRIRADELGRSLEARDARLRSKG